MQNIDQQHPTFKEVRKSCNSHKEALDAYAQTISEHYSLAKTQSERPQIISVATWFTYRTEGVSIGSVNLILLFFGVLSFVEKTKTYSFSTYHPISTKGQFWRILLSGLLEACGLIIGLSSLCLLILGLASLFFPESFDTIWKVLMILAGIVAFFVSRVLLRHSKVLKIPKEIFRDKTSPFCLYSLKKLTGDTINSKTNAP